MFLQFFAMFGFFFVSLQFLQLVLGYSTFEAALALLPMSIVILPISAVAGTMSEKYGHRLIGGIGLAVSAIGFGLFATLGTGSGFLAFMFVTIVIGAGAALAMTPATNAIVASLPRAKQGVASAVNDTSRELGAAFGVAVLGSAFNIGYRNSIDGHLDGSRRPRSRTRRARRRPSRCSSRDACPAATRSPTRHARRSRPGCATRCSWAWALLVIGAVFVWFRGASRTEEVLEDELDEPRSRRAA